MRHLWSFLAGLVVAPLTWALVTLGQDGSVRQIDRWVQNDTHNWANLIEPAFYLAVGGILLGLLGTLRISPLGPLVAGLLLIAPYAAMFVKPFGVLNRLPDDWKVFEDPLPLELPVKNGTLFLIGLLLLMATFSWQRWRRWPEPVAEAELTSANGPERKDVPLSDWPPAGSTDRDTSPLTLGYPDPTPSEPLPRRTGNESPWSAPPRTSNQPEDTSGIR